MSEKKAKPWHRKRHKFFQDIMALVSKGHLKNKQGFVPKPIELPDGPVLILCNHVCIYDPMMVGLCIKRPFYIVAMDDLTSRRFLGPILRFCFNLIPKAKSLTDYNCARIMMQLKEEGQKVLIFPEGNRTYNGKLCYIDEATAKMLQVFHTPIAFMNIVGGYGSEPRWSGKPRKGKCHVELRYLMQPDEVSNYNEEELMDKIREYLTVDDYSLDIPFLGKDKANYLERILFHCPDCGSNNALYSQGDDFICKSCGYRARYSEHLRFDLIQGKKRVETVYDWDMLDRHYLEGLDFKEDQGLIFKDEHISISKHYTYDPPDFLLKDCTVYGYQDRFVFENKKGRETFYFDEISAGSAVSKARANFYVDGQAYQIAGAKNLNAFKYVMLYYHYKNTEEGKVGKDEYFGI